MKRCLTLTGLLRILKIKEKIKKVTMKHLITAFFILLWTQSVLAQNVGIGTTAPHAPLQFANLLNDRKLVLYEDANNNHQVYGFGINAGILRYQIPNPGAHHIFSAGVNASSSLELMRITGSGYVGIKNSTPHAPLQFENIGGNRKLVMWEHVNNDHQFHGFGVNSSSTRYQVPYTNASHIFYAGTSDTSSAELMRITGNGRVGIGVSDPNEPLEIGGNGRAFFGDGAGPARKGLLIDAGPTSSRIESYNYAGSSPMSLLMNTLGGNVAINLTNANNKLDVHSGSARTGTHPQGLPLYVTGNISADTSGIEFRHSNGTQGIGFGYNTIYAAGSTSSQELGLSAKGGSGHLRFHTNENERMRITSSGNIGIGTASPTEKLHVSGNVKVTGNIDMTGNIHVEDVIHPTLVAPYTNVGSPMPPAGYYKDKENRVHLNGSVTSNSNPFYATLFTLPPGYRPAGSQNYIVYNEGGVARVLILSIGEVVIVSGTAGVVSLDQISFRATQ